MPVVLDVTVGGAAANSYATLADAETLASTLYPVSAGWLSATTDEKNRALYQARIELDQERFTGDRVDTTQACAWPRARVPKPGGGGSGYGLGGGSVGFYLTTEIPAAVQRAQIVRAIYVVDRVTANNGSLVPDDLAGVSSVSFGSELSLTLDPGVTSQTDRDRHFATVIRPILGDLVFAPQPRIVRG